MNARAGFFAGSALVLLVSQAWAAGPAAAPALPGPAFDGDRYADLWTKSPFAIATPDAPAASEDYELVGMEQFDGISYVNLIEKQSRDHFVLGSDKPLKKANLELKLVSINRGPGGASAVVMRNGESITLRQEEAPVNAAPPGMHLPLAMPPGMVIPPKGMVMSPNPSVGGMIPAFALPPPARFHGRIVRVPQPPPAH